MSATGLYRDTSGRVRFGETLCSHPRCASLAEAALDGEPYCIGHADDQAELIFACELNPGLAATFQRLHLDD